MADAGFVPFTPLVETSSGTFYGLTFNYGVSGTLYSITAAGSEKVVHVFKDVNSMPTSLTLGIDANFYVSLRSSVYSTNYTYSLVKVTRGGDETLLHTFPMNAMPTTLVQAKDGTFYGAIWTNGGTGVDFTITPSGQYHELQPATWGLTGRISQTFTDGGDGFLYGVGDGTAFRMTASGSLEVLHEFAVGPAALASPLYLSDDGYFYGTTSSSTDDLSAPNGIVYRMSRDGTVSTVTNFATVGPNTRVQPGPQLLFDHNGNLYVYSMFYPDVFSIQPDGSVTMLEDSFVDAAYVQGLTLSHIGDLYLPFHQRATADGIGKFTRSQGGSPTHLEVRPLLLYPDTADVGVPIKFEVTALNSTNDNAKSNYGVVHFSCNDPGATLPADAGLHQGYGQFTATFSRVGRFTITATDTAHPGLHGTSREIPVPGAATHFVISPPSTPVQSGIPFDVTVTAEDVNDSLASGYTGTVHLTSSDSEAVLPADITLSNGVGIETVQIYSLGAQTITATDVSSGFHSAGTVNVVRTLLEMNIPATVEAGSPFNFQVSTTMPQGISAPEYTGRFRFITNDPRSILPADTDFTGGAGGSATFTKTGGSSSHIKLTAIDLDHPWNYITSGDIAVVGGSTKVLSVGLPTVVQAGVPVSATVRALDQYGNVSSSYSGTVHFASTDSHAILPADTVLTNGIGTFNVKFSTRGSQTVTATDTVTSSIHGTSKPATVLDTVLLRVIAPSTVTAGVPFNCRVIALDRYFNLAPGYSGTVQFYSNAPRATLPVNMTLNGGTGTFTATLTKVGTVAANFKVTARDTVKSTIEGTSAAIAVTP